MLDTISEGRLDFPCDVQVLVLEFLSEEGLGEVIGKGIGIGKAGIFAGLFLELFLCELVKVFPAVVNDREEFLQ